MYNWLYWQVLNLDYKSVYSFTTIDKMVDQACYDNDITVVIAVP